MLIDVALSVFPFTALLKFPYCEMTGRILKRYFFIVSPSSPSKYGYIATIASLC